MLNPLINLLDALDVDETLATTIIEGYCSIYGEQPLYEVSDALKQKVSNEQAKRRLQGYFPSFIPQRDSIDQRRDKITGNKAALNSLAPTAAPAYTPKAAVTPTTAPGSTPVAAPAASKAAPKAAPAPIAPVNNKSTPPTPPATKPVAQQAPAAQPTQPAPPTPPAPPATKPVAQQAPAAQPTQPTPPATKPAAQQAPAAQPVQQAPTQSTRQVSQQKIQADLDNLESAVKKLPHEMQVQYQAYVNMADAVVEQIQQGNANPDMIFHAAKQMTRLRRSMEADSRERGFMTKLWQRVNGKNGSLETAINNIKEIELYLASHAGKNIFNSQNSNRPQTTPVVNPGSPAAVQGFKNMQAQLFNQPAQNGTQAGQGGQAAPAAQQGQPIFPVNGPYKNPIQNSINQLALSGNIPGGSTITINSPSMSRPQSFQVNLTKKGLTVKPVKNP